MLAEPNSKGGHTPKLRTACENCRQSKVKCNLSGKNMCIRCLRHGLQCQYGFANRSGKPKGSKNRATLRKMGQLPDDRPGRVSLGDRRQAEFVVEQKCHVAEQHLSHITYGVDPSMDTVRLPGVPDVPCTNKLQSPESIQGRLSESPGSFQGAMTVDTPLSTERSSIGSVFESNTSPGLRYLPDSMSPTFSPKESTVKGVPEFPFAVHIPYTIQPSCECVAIQVYHMNQLSRIALDTVQERFDQSLQNIKTTLSACRGFLQCSSCQKDSTNLLLSVSILDLTLQLFDQQIAHNEATYKPVSDAVNIQYGQYNLEREEKRRISNFLIRGLLLQCRDILELLKESFDLCIGPQKLLNPVVESCTFEGDYASSSLWMQFHPGHAGEGNGNCLDQILMGHEATVESLLRAVSLRECICN